MLVSDIVRRNAAFFGDCDAVVVPGQGAVSWRELDVRTSRLANGLVSLGLAKGDRVAMFAPNCGAYVEFFFGCAKSGLAGAAVNVRLTAAEITQYLRYVEPAAVLVHAGLAAGARQWLAGVPSVRYVIGVGDGHGFELDLEALIGGAWPGEPGVQVDEDDIYQLGATSGTTGIPKAAALTHRNAIAAMLSWLADTPVPERGTALQCIPFFFNPGGAAGLHPVLMKGGRTVIHQGFTPRAFLQSVADYHVTNTVLVPAMLQMILDEPGCRDFDLSSIRAIITGGAPLRADLLRRGRQLFGDVFYPIYGMAESYSCATMLRPASQHPDGTARQVAWLSSVGKPMVLSDVRVGGDDGQDVPADTATVGEIWVSGDTVSPGYFRMPDETAASTHGRWFKTGDAAVVDADGFITIVDRIKDVIITGGINVFSVEVERVLEQHPAVDQVAVIGVPHPRWGEAIHAVIRRAPGSTVTGQELLEFAGARLAGYKKPRSVEFADALPVSATGKILKRELRKRAHRDADASG